MNYSFSKTVEALKSSAVREILKLTQGGSVISFAGGLPADEFFPVAEMRAAFEHVFDHGNNALQYGLTEGYIPLREWIAERMKKKNMHVGIDNILLTTGSQQAIDLLCRIYVDRGDVILVENPTYLAALQLFQASGAHVVPVEGDVDGMDLDDLKEKVLRYRPKMLYAVPTFANPTGKVWSIERRKGLLGICQEHDVLILEDDPYSELRFNDEVFPSVFSLDEQTEARGVIYTSTFSKMIAPAVRTGWAMGDERVIRTMAQAKQATDLHSSSIDQQALFELLSTFDLDGHMKNIRNQYRLRKEMMHELLSKQGWSDAHWNEPKGGMFLWMELPKGIDTEELLKQSIKEGVAFVPGASFYAGEPMRNTLRMNYTFADEKTMTLGIERFARAVNAYTRQTV